MSNTRDTKPQSLMADHDIITTDIMKRAAEEAEKKALKKKAEEKKYVDNLLAQNNELIARDAQRVNEINQLTQRVNQLVSLTQEQSQTIDKLKLENENLLDMLGNQPTKSSAPTLFK